MAKPNFFCGIEALQALLGMELNGFEPEVDLTVDLIEAPYLFIYTAAADAWTMKVYGRGEIYNHEEGSGIEKGNLRVERKTGQGSGQCSDKVLSDNMGAFFHGCQQLSRYIQKEKLQPLYQGLDPEQAGIMLEVVGGVLKARKVAGMDRPEMVCTTLFGGMTKCRPYMEDFWDRSETEMMSLEEKIEKAEGGDKFAMAQLAQAYMNGDDEVEQDPKKAAYWYRNEAELQDAEGAFNLGLMYAKGFGVDRDFVQAAEWMEKAVAWGDSDGAAPAKQYRAMAENLKKAQAGDAAAMAEVAGTYMAMGGSLAQAGAGDDYAESLKWAQKAVDAGCPAGYWPLALAYEHGRGVTKDDKKAVELYKKGAELGHAACQHSYGCRFMTGEGVKKDVKQALALFEKSAAQGYGLAYQALGHMYETGEGVEPDFDKEMEYYEKACAALPDNAEFLRHVGYQYVNLMEGDEASWLRAVERAAYWLHKAADLGDGTARSGVDMFDRILELHKQGKIPAGSSLDQCMAYLSGKAPEKKGSNAQARPAKAPTPAKPIVKAPKADEQARKKAEQEAKTIHDAVRRARDAAKIAERAFDRANDEVQRKTSTTLEYYSYDFQSRLSEIVDLTVSACENLFNAYQNEIRKLDKICRPLINETRRRSEIQEIVDVIKWLNEESKVESNFNASFNSQDMGNVSGVSYTPDRDCVAIQRFWDDTLRKTPKTPEEIREEQEAKERREREAAERRRREEEARKERERKEKEEKAAYEKAMQEWNRKKAEIESRRAAELERSLEKFKKDQKAEIENTYYTQKAAAKAKLDQAQKQEQEAEAALSTLGFLQFGAKSEQKKRIQAAQTQADEAKAAMEAAEKAHRDAFAAFPDRVSQEKDRLTKVLNQRLPIPAQPYRPRSISNINASTRTSSQKPTAQTTNANFAEEIQAWMEDGVTYDITDIMSGVHSVNAAGLSEARVSNLMTQLVQRGTVVTAMVGGKQYYTLA